MNSTPWVFVDGLRVGRFVLDVLSAAGEKGTDIDFDENGQQEFVSIYRPRWFSHTPDLLQPPRRAPTNVKAEIARAAVLFWADLPACATTLRRVVELFLDAQRVPRRERDKDGKSTFIPLWKRINKYTTRIQATQPLQMQQVLHALRLTGNKGTHANGTDINKILLMVGWLKKLLEFRYPEQDPVLKAAAKIDRQQRRRRQASAPKAARKAKPAESQSSTGIARTSRE